MPEGEEAEDPVPEGHGFFIRKARTLARAALPMTLVADAHFPEMADDLRVLAFFRGATSSSSLFLQIAVRRYFTGGATKIFSNCVAWSRSSSIMISS